MPITLTTIQPDMLAVHSRHNLELDGEIAVPHNTRANASRFLTDPPPLKWSALRYGFRAKEDHDAEEETQARGDRCEAAPGGCAGVAGAERCRTLDWGYGGHVLPLAPGVWRAKERSGQATEGSRD